VRVLVWLIADRLRPHSTGRTMAVGERFSIFVDLVTDLPAGANVVLTGNCSALGDWDASRAPRFVPAERADDSAPLVFRVEISEGCEYWQDRGLGACDDVGCSCAERVRVQSSVATRRRIVPVDAWGEPKG
jgi:hypothetical protein